MASVFYKYVVRKNGELNRRKPVLNPTIQQVSVKLCNKFLKINNKYKFLKHIWKNIQKKAGSQSGDETSQFQFIYEILTFYFEQLLTNLSQIYSIGCIMRKK